MLLREIWYHTQTIFLHLWYTLSIKEIHTVEVTKIEASYDGEVVLLEALDNNRPVHHVIKMADYLNHQVRKGGYITVLYVKNTYPSGANVILSCPSHTAFDWLGCSEFKTPAIIYEHGEVFVRDGNVSIKLDASEYRRTDPEGYYLVPFTGGMRLIKS